MSDAVNAMNPVLALCAGLPLLDVPAGTVLLQESVRCNRLYVLRSGAFEVVREGVRVVRITEPGAFMGEISVLLGTGPTADVIATADSTVHVLEDAPEAVRAAPELNMAIARLLARRLHAITAYVVDVKRQYADSETHLGLMDEVIANILASAPGSEKPGSERGGMPDD